MTVVARDFDGYSRAISWLKVALPIIGLCILSTLFLVARETRMAQGEMPEELFAPDGGAETVSQPDYSGVTADGTSVSVVAESAWPAADGSGRVEGSMLTARFQAPDGDRADVRADAGALVPGEDVLALRGDVIVTTDSGWTMRSETLDASLDWTRLTSPTEVRTEGPLGTLDAGDMVITRDTEAESSYLMEFDGGVHLVYRP